MSLIQMLEAQLPAYVMQVVRLLAWLFLLSAIFIPLERFFALHHSKLGAGKKLQDIAYYFLNSLLPMALISIPMAMLAVVMQQLLPAGYIAGVSDLPPVARWALIFLVGEIGFYWGHRLSHEIPWLWRFHSVHHAPEHLYFLINTRAHPLDLIVTRLFGFVPIYILGLAGPGAGGSAAPAALIVLGTVWGFFIHANIRIRLGPLEWLMATPAFHHWHHTRLEPINRNFAAMLPVLDRLFGSHHLPPAWPEQYGLHATVPAAPATEQSTPPESHQRPTAQRPKATTAEQTAQQAIQ